MTYRNGNYCAFYVHEPFYENGLGAFGTPDFVYYQLLRAWKGEDPTFPFINSHMKGYSVRDGSQWETTLKPRLHDRLRNSKNIILVLSGITKESRALKEELEYGMGHLGLPVIVAYPGINRITVGGMFTSKVKELWSSVPSFEHHINEVPTVHVPFEKSDLRRVLSNPEYMVQTKKAPGYYTW